MSKKSEYCPKCGLEVTNIKTAVCACGNDFTKNPPLKSGKELTQIAKRIRQRNEGQQRQVIDANRDDEKQKDTGKLLTDDKRKKRGD